ncbi:MAG: cadmium-translocating P-type ATPase [Gammaproteobacteria bacterium]|jgi:Cu2+-exporting ATPase|nr:cadmium-translocating P-type ATPase [Gammaproteobacteria bacterium]
MGGTASCFHCGTAIAGTTGHELQIDGTPVALCSSSCLEIATRIRDKGLTGFYRFRTGASTPASEDAASGRWASYDREALQKEFVSSHGDGSREAQLLLQGVRCAACSWLIERAMAAVPGVLEIAVDPLTTRTRLRWDPHITRLGDLLRQVAALGYDPLPYTEDEAGRAAILERRAALPRLIVAGLGMSETMGYAIALYAGALHDADPGIHQFLRLISLLVATPVVFYAGAPFFSGAVRGLRLGRPGMDVPVALAIAAAYIASVWNTFRGSGEVYFDSAVMFVFFLSCARFLEMSGRHRALSLTGALARHLPRVATRLRNGRPEIVGVVELVPGDLVLVPPGQSIPVDGRLESASASVDESLLTGESRPVRKAAGQPVVAGSINLLGAATVRVERVGTSTMLAQISRLMAVAREERPRLVEVTDRVAVWFVSGVLLLAAATGAAWWLLDPSRAFDIVLAVLVVTCPCALALATPAAFTVGMSALARRGVLLRRAGALEILSRITDMVFDKTGTLTEHSAGIHRIETFTGQDPGQLLELAALLESRSEHPLARAFPAPATAVPVTDVVAVPGKGIEGCVDGQRLRIGTQAFVLGAAGDGEAAEGAEPAAQSVYLGSNSQLMARFEIAERVRSEAPAVLAALADAGIALAIASGDQAGPVRAAADRLGIARWHARLSPADKLALVRSLQQDGRRVGMVGDGINDSPVLAGADVSIAIGTGTSLAQHAADCILMGPGLGALPAAVAHSRRTMHIVRQNLWWAVGYNLVAVPLAITGLLAPWLAALGMSASSLLVTFNALRLGRMPQAAASAPGVVPGTSEVRT